jgi:competence protein ComGC
MSWKLLIPILNAILWIYLFFKNIIKHIQIEENFTMISLTFLMLIISVFYLIITIKQSRKNDKATQKWVALLQECSKYVIGIDESCTAAVNAALASGLEAASS